jgi:energy-converting hydrogenase Eha subunit E
MGLSATHHVVVAPMTNFGRRRVRVASGVFHVSLVGVALILVAEELTLALLGVPAATAAASLAVRRAASRWPDGS